MPHTMPVLQASQLDAVTPKIDSWGHAFKLAMGVVRRRIPLQQGILS